MSVYVCYRQQMEEVGVLIGTASVRSVILPPRMEAANDWVDLTLTNQIIGFIVSMV